MDKTTRKSSNSKAYRTGAEPRTGARLSVEVVRSLEELQPHALQWDELAFHAEQRLPTLSYAWVSSFLEHRLSPEDKWCCLFAYDDSRQVGVLPLVIAPLKVLGFRRSVFRQPRDPHTHSVDVLAEKGRETEVVQSFLRAMDQVAPGWYCLEMERLSALSPVVKVLHGFTRQGMVLQSPAGSSSCVPTHGDFEKFHAGLSRNFRRNLTKATRKLAGLKQVETEFVAGDKATPRDLERFMKIEASGWKGRGGSAILMSTPLVEFYTTLVDRLAQRGWLEWHFLAAEGKTIAGHLAIRCGRSLVIWKIGYDEAYARCAPGTILLQHTIRRAFESSEIDEVNLVTDKSWHDNWRPNKRPYCDLWVYPMRPLPLITGGLPKQSRMALKKVPLLRSAVRRARRLFGRTEG